ncbi:MAG: GGDEF domain-containing protein [Alphaproteobacteria bacterium]|nr:GGDEF domain-containing protein [Alphaproteobacteria bacterium]
MRLAERHAARTADLKAANDRLRGEIDLRRKAEARARRQARTDELTGLNNRRGFLTLATRRYRLDSRAGKPSCLLFADVDGLKAVNDTEGHTAGDRLIASIGKAFRTTFGETYIVGRLGGDEFAVYGSGAGESPETLRRQLTKAVSGVGRRVGVAASLSAGIACATRDHAPPFEALLRAADGAMYAEKQAKRTRNNGAR